MRSTEETYRAAIEELTIEQVRLRDLLSETGRELEEVTVLIRGLEARLATKQHDSISILRPGLVEPGAFIGLTVREAIKKLFRDCESGGLTTAEIATRLRAGGIRSQGADFASNVSAPLGVMAKNHNEVVRGEDGKWTSVPLHAMDFDPGISDDDVPF